MPMYEPAQGIGAEEILEKIQARRSIVEPYVLQLFPDKPVAVSDLSQEQKEEAECSMRQFGYKRRNLVNGIVQSSIENSQLPEYISKLHEFSKLFVENNEVVTVDAMNGWVHTNSTLEQIMLNTSLAKEWISELLAGLDEKTRKTRAVDFGNVVAEISGINVYPHPPAKSEKETREYFSAFKEAYKLYYSLTDEQRNSKVGQYYLKQVQNVGLINKDPRQSLIFIKLFKDFIFTQPQDDLTAIFADAVSRYSNHQGLSEDKAVGLKENLYPALRSKDQQVEILLRQGNIWGMDRGDFGIGDFICYVYANRINPQNINQMLVVSRSIPATDLARLERNRHDALLMAAPFGVLRDFIHDQRPYVHEVLAAMVEYYDTKDRKALDEILPKTDSGYLRSNNRTEGLYDITRYDNEVDAREGSGKKIPVIEIVRRLAKNTEKISDKPPATKDEELNLLLNKVDRYKSEKTLQRKHTVEAMKHINSKLSKYIEDNVQGIDPNDIYAISWLEHQGFRTLQNLNFEEQVSAYTQDWFHTLLKFEELTFSPSFNDSLFNQYISEVKSQKDPREAYQLIAKHTLVNINSLARKYKERGITDVGFLWSGNIAHELIGLTEFKEASTEQGRKFKNEKTQAIIEPGFHPGD